MPLIWPPTKDMGGVLSLGVIPTAQEYQYCGFDFIIPFASSGIRETLINTVGAKVIPNCSQGTRVWADETGVVGYFLADDTVYDVGLVRSWYDRMKAKTSKPVGSIFWRPPHDTDRNRLISISNFLDFILPYDYPYRDGRSLSATNGYIEYMISLAKDLNCPVILGAQAMDDDFRAMADPGEVGVRNQYEKYHNAGFPIWWYSWTNKVTDIKRNYQDLMHEWYAEVAILPYSCPYCPDRFLTQAQLDAHIASEHPSKIRLIGIGSGYARPLELNYKWILDNVSGLGLNCVRFHLLDLRESLTESQLSKIYDFCAYAKQRAMIVVVSISQKRVSSSSSDWPRQEEIITRLYNRLVGLGNIIWETGNELTQGYEYEMRIVNKLRSLGAKEIMSSALTDAERVRPYVNYFSYHAIYGTGAINRELGSKTVYDTDGCSLETLTASNLYAMAKKAFERGSHFFFDEGLKSDGSFTDPNRVASLKRASDDTDGEPEPEPGWSDNLVVYPGFRGKEDFAGWNLAYGRIHIYCGGIRGRSGTCEATDAEIDPTEIYQVVNIPIENVDRVEAGVYVRKTSEAEKVRLIFEYQDAGNRVLSSYDTGWFTGYWHPSWRLYEDERPMPTNCVKVKIRLMWGYKEGSTNDNNMTDAYVKVHVPSPEVVTTKTIIHSCNVKISYQVSSFAENNDALTCPNCGMALGVEGIRGSEEIVEVLEVITPHIITCAKCGSQLKLSVSSIAEKNTEQYCPVCGEPAD